MRKIIVTTMEDILTKDSTYFPMRMTHLASVMRNQNQKNLYQCLLIRFMNSQPSHTTIKINYRIGLLNKMHTVVLVRMVLRIIPLFSLSQKKISSLFKINRIWIKKYKRPHRKKKSQTK